MAASSHHAPGPDDDRREWIVLWHLAAVEEFNQLKEMKVRKAGVSVVAALRQRGPRLSEPHSKKVRGDEKLYELRPAGRQEGARTAPLRPARPRDLRGPRRRA